MREKSINNLFLVLISIFAVALAAVIFLNLAAYIFYEKAIKMKLPVLKIEKINYYNNAILLLSRAVEVNKLNAEYPAFKADLLFGLLSEDNPSAGDARKKEIEDLYLRAISLNPVNFEYHLKLGWFYAQMNEKKAEDEMQKAIKLYPSYYRNYFYIAKYYLKSKREKEAFCNILLSLYHGGELSLWRPILRELGSDLKSSQFFTFEEKKKYFSFFVFMPGAEFSFEKYGFPHINTLFTLRVYMKNEEAPQISLYKNNTLAGNFKKISPIDGANVYEFGMDQNMADVFLDELTIKTEPRQSIEKIEFIKNFNRK